MRRRSWCVTRASMASRCARSISIISEWDCLLEEAEFDRERSTGAMPRCGTSSGRRGRCGSASGRSRVFRSRHDHGSSKIAATATRSVRDLWLRSGLAEIRYRAAGGCRCLPFDRACRGAKRSGLCGRSTRRVRRRSCPCSTARIMPIFRWSRKPALPEMLPGEQVIEDYRYLSLSLKAHPVSFLRMSSRRWASCANGDLLNVPNGQRVTIAGLVLVRQRPGSAKGVIFMTLEDETGRRQCHRLDQDIRPIPVHRHGRPAGEDQGQAAERERGDPCRGRSYRGHDVDARSAAARGPAFRRLRPGRRGAAADSRSSPEETMDGLGTGAMRGRFQRQPDE